MDEFVAAQVETYFASPESLLDDIDAALDAAPVEMLPLIALDPAAGPYREVTHNRPRHAILEAILRAKEDLVDLCCRRMRYCELKVRHGETINLVKAVFDGWISAVVAFPIPAATVAAYCVQSLFLDRLCQCSPVSADTSGPQNANGSESHTT